MTRNLTLFILLASLAGALKAQMISPNIPIKDDMQKVVIMDQSGTKRSVSKPTSCSSDTVQYPYYKSTALVTISVSRGRSLGQLYNCPKPLVLTGFSFYAFIVPNPPTSKKMNLICNVYKAGRDSLPSGRPLRSDTITIDSTFGGGVLSKIEKKAYWSPITLDSAYILTIETDSASLTAGVVTNSYNNGDGKRENLNSGSISGLWYNGKNLNVNGIPFDCDILLHPFVQYKFGTDFTIKSNCYNINDTVKLINLAPQTMAGSKMYNRYLIYNLAYICHLWDYDDGNGWQYTVDGKVKYAYKQNANIMLVSTIYGYKGGMMYGCSDTVFKSLSFKPDQPSISGRTNVCIGDTAMLTAYTSDPGVTYQWLKKPNSSTPFFTGAIYIKYPIVSNDTFYVRAVNGTCISPLRTVILRANAYPSSLTVVGDSVCAGSKATLKATANVGKLTWYTQPVGGLPFYSGSNYQTNVLLKDTFFYVEANNFGCVLSPRAKVNALVGSNFAPASPVVSPDTTVCLGAGGSVILKATAGVGLTVRWYNSSGTLLTTGSTYSFVPGKREVKTFYADAYNGVCGSTKEPVNITIEKYPDLSSISMDTICNGDSAILSCTVPYGNVSWYDAATGGNLISNAASITVYPSSTTNYYIETSSDVCVNSSRGLAIATVNDFPKFTKLWGDTICSKNTALLRAVTGGPGIVKWFEYDTSGTELATGNSFVTQVLAGNKKYFARSEYAGCIGPMTLVQPTVKNSPFSGFVFDVLTWQQVRVSPINSTGSSIFWDFGDGFNSTKFSVTHRYQNIGFYNIKLVLTSQANACKDSTTVNVEILESNLKALENLPELNVYPNPNSGWMVLSSDNLTAKTKIEIYDAKGALVKMLVADAQDGNVRIDLSGFGSGVYTLMVDGYKPILFVKQ